MGESLVLVDRRGDGVVHLRLNCPPLNALTSATLDALHETAVALSVDAACKAVVISGSEKAFSVGADITEFGGPQVAREIGARFRAALDGIASVPRPVIAAIRGIALGGGLELALACDLRVVAETARLGLPEVHLGIIPGGGGTQRLPRLVGPSTAKDLIWSGRHVRGTDALEIGLADRVSAVGEVEETALEWAGSFARGAVAAMGLAKQVIDEGLGEPLPSGLDREGIAFVDVFATDDASVGISSFLANGPGKAEFSGR